MAITPACGFVTPVGSIGIGVIAGALCALAVALKYRFGFDDSLDVVGVHLVGGLVGTLLIGFFATTSVNSLGADGLPTWATRASWQQAVRVAGLPTRSWHHDLPCR